MQLWTRYPNDKTAQDTIKKHADGLVIGNSWAGYTHPEYDLSRPNWNRLDERLASIPEGTPVHFHPILARCPGSALAQLKPIALDVVMTTIERYPWVKRWTLANEMLTLPGWESLVIEIYEKVSKRWPHLELWAGEYSLRSNARVNGLIPILYELKAACPGFKGLVFIDYMDLSFQGSKTLVEGIADWLPLKSKYAHTEKLNEILLALEQQYKSFAIPNLKIEPNLQKLRQTGIDTALEVSVFTGPNPTAATIARQVIAYREIVDLCDRNSTELWQWNLVNGPAVSITWAANRQGTDQPGWFDRDGQVKEWAKEFLG